MKRAGLLAGLILCSALAGQAQEAYPRAEIFAGYAYARTDINVFASPESSHGWAATASVNFRRSFGVTAEFSGHYGKLIPDRTACILVFPPPPECSQQVNFSTYQILAGPRLTIRFDRLTWFSHALVGALQRRTASYVQPGYTVGTITVPTFTVPPRSPTDIAMGFGMGLDLDAGNRFGLRPIQLDYVPASGNGYYWLSNLRVRAGLVVKFLRRE